MREGRAEGILDDGEAADGGDVVGLFEHPPANLRDAHGRLVHIGRADVHHPVRRRAHLLRVVRQFHHAAHAAARELLKTV